MNALRTMLGVLAFLAPLAAVAQAPKVIGMTPENGARDVDPALAEIVIVFDQPMRDGSWSWCGGGEEYPEGTGKPFFRDARTAVMPVKLEPQHHYALSINCPAARNFVGANGLPAEYSPLEFTTGSGKAPVTANPNNAAAYAEVREIVLNSYSHFERTGTDWVKTFDDAEEWVMESPTPAEWSRRVAELLGPAKDPHLFLRDPAEGRVYPTFRRNAVPNADPGAVKLRLDRPYQPVEGIVAGNLGGVGYIAIDTWTDSPEFAAALNQLMQFAKSLPALIVDVRMNGGGSENAAKKFAQWFVAEPGVYSKNRYRDPLAEGGWTETIERTIEPNPEEMRFKGTVVLLQGPVCLSSNESFILMMNLAPNVTTLGATTGGSSANPKEHALANGFVFVVPSWEDFMPDGTPLEGNGIAPDVEFEFTRTMKDPLFEKALEMTKNGA